MQIKMLNFHDRLSNILLLMKDSVRVGVQAIKSLIWNYDEPTNSLLPRKLFKNMQKYNLKENKLVKLLISRPS